MEEAQQRWHDASYLELALALQSVIGQPEKEQLVINEFVRREHEYVSIHLSDYLALQKAKQLLEAVKYIVHNRWMHDLQPLDECYMLALSEILHRYYTNLG